MTEAADFGVHKCWRQLRTAKMHLSADVIIPEKIVKSYQGADFVSRGFPGSFWTAIWSSAIPFMFAFSQDVLVLVPCVQLGVCEPMAIPLCPKWSRAPGHMQTDFAYRCRDIDLSCCLFQGKFYICTTCVMPSRFRGKGLQDGKAGSARHPRASLPSVKSCLRHSRAGSQPRQQLRYRDEECDLIFLYSGNRYLPWKWSSFPSLNWWCHVWDCASHWDVTRALPQSVICHTELLFYNRIIRTDSAPDILSPITMAFGLQCGLNYIVVLLTLPSTALCFVNRVTDHSLWVESTAFL